MTLDEGRALTVAWIAQHAIRDSAGREHFPHGIWTTTSRLFVFVAFDSHPILGRQAWYFFTERLQRLAEAKKNWKPRYGGIESASTADTGAGYLFGPGETFVDRVEPIPAHITSDDPNTACLLVREQMMARRGIVAAHEADKSEQRVGIDLVFEDQVRRYGVNPLPVEVKSRRKHQGLPGFFLQVSETNPDRLI